MSKRRFTADDFEDFYRYTEGASALREMMKQAGESERMLARIFSEWPAVKQAVDAWDLMDAAGYCDDKASRADTRASEGG